MTATFSESTVPDRSVLPRVFESLQMIRTIVLVAAIADPSLLLASESLAADSVRSLGKSMCVECDKLNAQLRIVRDKIASFEEGREILEATRRELQSDATRAKRFAKAYMTLQSANIGLGIATLPCSIPARWLKGLIGGASGLGSYIERRDAGEATLAGIVAFSGFGVVNDANSLADFAKEYRQGAADVAALYRHVEAAIRRFDRLLDSPEAGTAEPQSQP